MQVEAGLTSDAVHEPPPPARRDRPRVSHVLTYLALPVALMATWEIAAIVLAQSLGPFFPRLSTVMLALYDWATGATGSTGIYSGHLAAAILDSVKRILIGFAIACALGIPLGILVGWIMGVRRAVDPFLQTMRPIPVAAWVPISMLWFGIGNSAAIYLIVIATFFPIYVNTVHGVRYVDRVTIRAGRMLGASHWRLLVYVVLPAALPSIFAGLRISVGFAWMAVVVSELVAVKNGLGYVMFDAYGFLRADIVVAAMIVIGVLGFVCDRGMVMIERRVLAWAHTQQET